MWFHYAGHWQPEAGSWAWPAGFSPGLLQRVTNGYLQCWADKVRAEVVRRTLGPSIRDEVVALNAIARQCLGEAVPAPAPPGGAAAPARACRYLDVGGADGPFAAVRDREVAMAVRSGHRAARRRRGEPQLVDTVGARDVEEAAIASPWLTLTAACGDKRAYAAPLAAAATRLRDAIGAAAQEQVQTDAGCRSQDGGNPGRG